MMYGEGTNDSYCNNYNQATVTEIADLIHQRILDGKINCYDGGKEDSRMAICRYSKKGYIYNYSLKLKGTMDEFRELEQILQGYTIEVHPRETATLL